MEKMSLHDLAGDLKAPAFGQSKDGLAPHINRSGRGKYTLKANLGAGDLLVGVTRLIVHQPRPGSLQ
jgi:hypothetical protein